MLARLAQPFAQRAMATLRSTVAPVLGRITPAGAIEKTRHNITMAGMTETVTPEELIVGQVVLGVAGLFLAIVAVTSSGSPAARPCS